MTRDDLGGMNIFFLKNKNILLISPEPWSHIFVSKHHYARHLALLGNNVFFLNPPSTTFQVTVDSHNLRVLDYRGFPKGIRFLPGFVQRWLILFKVRAFEKLCNVKFDIIWSFDNSVFYDLRAIPEEVFKISHIVDLNMNFHMQRAALSTDLALCTTEILKNRFKSFGVKAHKINHGLNLKNESVNVELPGCNEKKALYMGNLAMRYIDWKIILRSARDLKNLDFIFVGPGKQNFDAGTNSYHKYKRELQSLSNAYFLDAVPTSSISSYLKEADILLVAYREEHHKDQANPHKIMEYLASGKIIVATYTEEYLNKKELFLMSIQNKGWPNLLKLAVENSSEFNSDIHMLARKNYAFENTYYKQITRIDKLIAAHENIVG